MPMPRRAEAPSDIRLTVRLSPEEREQLQRAAQTNRQSISGFARDAILNAADDTLDEEEPIES